MDNEVTLGTLQLARETKGTYLYKGKATSTSGDGRELSQYVPKTAFAGKTVPQEIEVVIKW